MADQRSVSIDTKAVLRAEDYILATKREKGIRLTIGSVFAMALDRMLEGEKTEARTGV